MLVEPQDGTVRTLSLAQSAAARIAEEIASGNVRPGQRLPPEPELALQLGLSRGALREGLRTLESVGLLRAHVGQGRFVADTGSDTPSVALTTLMKLQPSGDIMAVRRLLEPAAVRDMPAAEMAATAAKAGVVLAKLRAASARSAVNQAVRYHRDFHLLLVQFGSTRLLRTLLTSLIDASAATHPAILRDRGAARHWIVTHALILEALEAGDIETTVERVREHLQPAFVYPVTG